MSNSTISTREKLLAIGDALMDTTMAEAIEEDRFTDPQAEALRRVLVDVLLILLEDPVDDGGEQALIQPGLPQAIVDIHLKSYVDPLNRMGVVSDSDRQSWIRVTLGTPHIQDSGIEGLGMSEPARVNSREIYRRDLPKRPGMQQAGRSGVRPPGLVVRNHEMLRQMDFCTK